MNSPWSSPGPERTPIASISAAAVVVEDEDGERHRYRLVGPDEFDAAAGRISVDSPVGRALMGKRLGDEALIRRPKGDAVWEIVEIGYDD